MVATLTAASAAGSAYLVVVRDEGLARSVASELRARLAAAAVDVPVLVPPVRGDDVLDPVGTQRIRAWWSALGMDAELDSAVLVALDEDGLAGLRRAAFVAVPTARLGCRVRPAGSAVVEVPAETVRDLVDRVAADVITAHDHAPVRPEPNTAATTPVVSAVRPEGRDLVWARRWSTVVGAVGSVGPVLPRVRRFGMVASMALALGLGSWAVSSLSSPEPASAAPVTHTHDKPGSESHRWWDPGGGSSVQLRLVEKRLRRLQRLLSGPVGTRDTGRPRLRGVVRHGLPAKQHPRTVDPRERPEKPVLARTPRTPLRSLDPAPSQTPMSGRSERPRALGVPAASSPSAVGPLPAPVAAAPAPIPPASVPGESPIHVAAPVDSGLPLSAAAADPAPALDSTGLDRAVADMSNIEAQGDPAPHSPPHSPSSPSAPPLPAAGGGWAMCSGASFIGMGQQVCRGVDAQGRPATATITSLGLGYGAGFGTGYVRPFPGSGKSVTGTISPEVILPGIPFGPSMTAGWACDQSWRNCKQVSGGSIGHGTGLPGVPKTGIGGSLGNGCPVGAVAPAGCSPGYGFGIGTPGGGVGYNQTCVALVGAATDSCGRSTAHQYRMAHEGVETAVIGTAGVTNGPPAPAPPHVWNDPEYGWQTEYTDPLIAPQPEGPAAMPEQQPLPEAPVTPQAAQSGSMDTEMIDPLTGAPAEEPVSGAVPPDGAAAPPVEEAAPSEVPITEPPALARAPWASSVEEGSEGLGPWGLLVAAPLVVYDLATHDWANEPARLQQKFTDWHAWVPPPVGTWGTTPAPAPAAVPATPAQPAAELAPVGPGGALEPIDSGPTVPAPAPAPMVGPVGPGGAIEPIDPALATPPGPAPADVTGPAPGPVPAVGPVGPGAAIEPIDPGVAGPPPAPAPAPEMAPPPDQGPPPEAAAPPPPEAAPPAPDPGPPPMDGPATVPAGPGPPMGP